MIVKITIMLVTRPHLEVLPMIARDIMQLSEQPGPWEMLSPHVIAGARTDLLVDYLMDALIE